MNGANRRQSSRRKGNLARSGAGRLSHAGVPGLDDGLGPVGDLEFGEDVRYVVADCLGAERQPACNHAVGPALGEQVEDLVLAVGQLREWWWRRGGVSEVGDHPSGQLATEDDLAAGNGLDGAADLFPAGAFEQIPAGTSPQTRQDRAVVVKHG